MADDNSQEAFDQDPLQSMKVTELRKELKARGLLSTGTKVELIERLQSAIVSTDKDSGFEVTNTLPEASNTGLDLTGTENDTEESETAEIDESTEVHDTVEIEKLTSRHIEVKPLKKRAIHETSNGSVSTDQKITLDRNSVAVAPVSVMESSSVELTAEVPANDEDSKISAQVTEKTTTTVKTMSAQERLAMRAQRFNVTSNENKTLKLSKDSVTPTVPGKTTSKNIIEGPTKAPDLDILKKRAERFGESVSTIMKQLEEKERALKRKLRFGASAASSAASSADEQAKKKIRAQRFGMS